MAVTEHGRRRFITRHDVEDAAAAGRSLVVQGRDVLTDEAAQRALDLGVVIERPGGRQRGGGSAAGSGSAGSGSAGSGRTGGQGGSPRRASAGQDELRKAVRAAVVAELGREPDGLDAAIDRVLGRRA